MTTLNLAKSGCLFVLITLLSLTTKAQLHAEFSATPVSGCAPLVVNFTDQSTGNPTQWKWDLGNGTISFLQNPSTTYFLPGQHAIKLVIQNASGKDSIIKTQYITIYSQPTVDFSSSPRSGCFPLPVQFTDLSSTDNGNINQWQWDFGDGNFGNTQNPSHVYTAGGNYNVSLVVTNSNGCFKSLTKSQYVQIAEGVTADFTNNTQNSCTPPVNINFQNTSIGTGPLTYLWDLGDGTTSSDSTPSHNYTTLGSYTVQLIVTNSSGCRDTITKPNAVTIGTINTSFNGPDSVCVGTSHTFTNTSTPLPAGSSWDFGDGTTSTLLNPVKIYVLPGSYQVKLVNNFGACLDSMTKNITVSPLPTVSFSTTDTLSCNAPFTVNFTNNSTGATSYLWLFGDGTTSTQANPVHTYMTAGNFSVRLICTNSFGCTNNITKTDYIKIQLPQAMIDSLPKEGCAPFSWTFTSTVNSLEPVTGYQWDFGDGSTSTEANPIHIFGPGNYNIRLIVTTANGCTDTVTVIRGIKVGLKPDANFSATPRDVCAHIPVNFSDISTGTVDQWLWDFGDGGTSISQNPTHVYEDTGYFPIQLIIWNNGCTDTLKVDQYIHINPPIAAFAVSANCNAPYKRVFIDQSIGADEWNWNFGDGNTSTQPSPVHTYAAQGTYTVTLVVRNFTTGCTYTKIATVIIIEENADFRASDTVVCRNNPINFSAIVTNPASIGLFQWSFGDGGSATGQFATHTYTVPGYYAVTLITIDRNVCRDTLVKTHYISVNGPTAAFSVPANASCLLSSIHFSDSSISDGTHPITQWIWDYGDGIIDTLASGPFNHTYATPGIYTVTLTVKDNSGCADRITRTNLLTISKPTANFTAVTLACPGRPVQFTNGSTGTGLLYDWDFGDGSTSNQANPLHTYATDGIFTIKLVVFDQYGCTDSITRNSYITVVTPTANFTVSDSIGTCPPLIVNFTNTSQNFASLHWNFGDGTSSTNTNPSHFYNIPGTYYAVLTITGIGGCTSTKQQKITVRGPYGSFTYGALEGCSPLRVNFTANTHDRVSFIWDFNDGNTLATTDSIVSHVYSIPGTYVPKMILIDAGGCTVAIRGRDTVRVHGITAGLDFNTVTQCDPATIQFNNSSTGTDSIATFTWQFGDGLTSAAENPAHLYSGPGLYYPSLKVTSIYGCVDSIRSTTPVKIVATPQALITQSANGCTPVTVSFNGGLAVADTSALSWQWDFGNGNTSTLKTPPAQAYTVAGTYPVRLLVTNSTGCMDTVLASVQAFALPNVKAGPDTTICLGTGQTLQATGAVGYTWSPSTGLSCTTCANPVANPASATTYIVKGTSAEGCVRFDSILVSVKYPFSMTNSLPDSLCKGSTLRLFAAGAYSYSWSPATGLDNPTSANPVASPVISTTYRVIGSDNLGCFKDTGFVPIRVFNIPTVEAGPDRTINVGQTTDLVPLVSADVNSVIWNPTGSIFRSDYPSITVKPRETTTYTVQVSNSGGCTSRDNLTVYVICNGANVFIPNTFSPNGDGSNDIFYPRGSGLFSIKTAKIFNRWGELVYEKGNFMANDANAGWDGTYKGQKLNADVFVYVIEILCDNSTLLVYKGNVALIK